MSHNRADLHRDRLPTGDLDLALPGSPATPLRKLHGYRVAEGDPDVRGWEVVGADDRRIGHVDDLLVDTPAMKVRYLEVALALDLLAEAEPGGSLAAPGLISPMSAASAMGGQAPMASEALVQATLAEEETRLMQEPDRGSSTRHILIPVGFARLDREHARVLVEELHADDAAGLPDYDGQRLDREDEVSLRRWFDQTHAEGQESDFYAHDLYDEDRFYGPRRLDSSQAIAETARSAGLEPGGVTPAGDQDWTITGELDRAVNAPDHSVLREGAAEAPREEEVSAAKR